MSNNTTPIFWLSVIFLASLTLGSCSNLQDELDIRKQARKAKVSLQSLSIKSIDMRIGFPPKLNYIDVAADLLIKNDSNHPLLFDRFNLQLALDNAHISSIDNHAQLLVGKKSSQPHTLVVRIHNTSIKTLLNAKNMHLTGWVEVKLRLLDDVLSVPFKVSVKESISANQIQKLLQQKIKESGSKLLRF